VGGLWGSHLPTEVGGLLAAGFVGFVGFVGLRACSVRRLLACLLSRHDLVKLTCLLDGTEWGGCVALLPFPAPDLARLPPPPPHHTHTHTLSPPPQNVSGSYKLVLSSDVTSPPLVLLSCLVTDTTSPPPCPPPHTSPVSHPPLSPRQARTSWCCRVMRRCLGAGGTSARRQTGSTTRRM
jgi:hypothetical protein